MKAFAKSMINPGRYANGGGFQFKLYNRKTSVRRLSGDLLKLNIEEALAKGKEHMDNGQRQEARINLLIAAKHENAEAAYLLGVLSNTTDDTYSHSNCSNAMEVLVEINLAKSNAKKAKQEKRGVTKHGFENHQHELGQSIEGPLFWLLKAVTLGHGEAMVYLANIIIANVDDRIQDNKLKSVLAESSSELCTEVRCSKCVVSARIEQRGLNIKDISTRMWDMCLAVNLYERAGNLKPPVSDALYNLGQLYFEGRAGLIVTNKRKAFSYFKRAAAARDSSALLWVGICYMSGEGREKVEMSEKDAGCSIRRDSASIKCGDSPQSESLGLSFCAAHELGNFDQDMEDVGDLKHSAYNWVIEEGIRPRAAETFLKLSADAGNNKAYYYLATLFRSGLVGLSSSSILQQLQLGSVNLHETDFADHTDVEEIKPDLSLFQNYLLQGVEKEDPDAMYCLSVALLAMAGFLSRVIKV